MGIKLFGERKGQRSHDEIPCDILVLGGGCANCRLLEERVRAALNKAGRKDPVGHVTDFREIGRYGVMHTPALVVRNQVVVSGRVSSVEELEQVLQQSFKRL